MVSYRVKVHLLNSRKPPNNINNPILVLIPVLILDIQDINIYIYSDDLSFFEGVMLPLGENTHRRAIEHRYAQDPRAPHPPTPRFSEGQHLKGRIGYNHPCCHPNLMMSLMVVNGG